MGYRQGEVKPDPTGRGGELEWDGGGGERVGRVSFRGKC